MAQQAEHEDTGVGAGLSEYSRQARSCSPGWLQHELMRVLDQRPARKLYGLGDGFPGDAVMPAFNDGFPGHATGDLIYYVRDEYARAAEGHLPMTYFGICDNIAS